MFVEAHINHAPAWWRRNIGLVLDGVTLTRAPKPLSGKEKHAAQAIKHMWVKSGESLVATLDLSAANLSALSKDHWMKNSLNIIQLHLRESVKRSR